MVAHRELGTRLSDTPSVFSISHVIVLKNTITLKDNIRGGGGVGVGVATACK